MTKRLVLTLALLGWLPLVGSANDWPTWRGPGGDGKLPDEASYPEEWSADDGMAWKVSLPAPGNSSAIVSDGHLFLTVAENGGRTRSLLCFATEDGTLKWSQSVDYGKEDITHKTNPYCAASPVTDGSLVYAWHGNGGLLAYDFEGNERWRQDLGTDYEHQWGPNAASPVLVGDVLLVSAGPGVATRLIAVDKLTGEMLWKQELPEAASESAKDFRGSWATPLIVETGKAREALIGFPGFVGAFALDSGAERWRITGLSDLCYTNVVSGGGRAAYLCGYGGPGIGFRLPEPGESGDLTESHRLWADPPRGQNQNPQRIGSGQVVGDHLYLLNEPGVIQCLEMATGKSAWKERLSRRKSWSSMNLVGGRLYINDVAGTTFVVAPDPGGLNLLATNELGAGLHTNASLAFAGGRIFLRTDTVLFAIEGR